MIVLDASAAASVLLNQDISARHILERMERADDGLHVPHLFEIEVMNVLRRYALSGRISEERGAELFEDLVDMEITRYLRTPPCSPACGSCERT